MPWPHPDEICILTVQGVQYRDWETILVKHSLREPPFYTCRFTCSEQVPIAKNFATLQIMPGYVCTVTLGGILAFTGRVTTRQVVYNATRHYIEIQCATNEQITTSSVVHQTGEFKNKTVEQIAREVLKPLGINLKVEGGELPRTPIPVVRVAHGTSVHDFLDDITRPFSQLTGIGISFTSNANGDFVIVVGPSGGQDAVIEGQNILEGREVLWAPQMAGGVPIVNQAPATDQKHGSSVAHEPFFSQAFQNLGRNFVPSVIVGELPFWDKRLLQGRAISDRNWLVEDFVSVYATVQGWMRPSGGLWTRGQNVSVTSPMLVMDGTPLILKVVQFTQDSRTGTRTTLELVNAKMDSGGVPQATPNT